MVLIDGLLCKKSAFEMLKGVKPHPNNFFIFFSKYIP